MPTKDMADLKKRAMWTNMLGNMSIRDFGPVWVVKASQMHEWNCKLKRKDKKIPYELYMISKAKDDWMQMHGTTIKGTKQDHKSMTIECKITKGLEI